MKQTEPSSPETSAALDALAITVTAAREFGADDAWATGMQAAYATAFDSITKLAAAHMTSELARRKVRAGSTASIAAFAAGRQSISFAVAEFYKLLVGSMIVSARLIERLAVATNTDPDEIMRAIAKDDD